MQYINYIKGWLASTRRRLTSIKGRQASRVERAQLLLITALALAVILVTVALLLNAAIFTENVATRDTTADGHEAIELRGELVDGIGEAIETENHDRSGNADEIEKIIEGDKAIGSLVNRERARGSEIATLSYDSSEPGELIQWNVDGNPRNLDDLGNNWTLVDPPGNTRGYRLTFDPSTLNGSTAESSDEVLGVRFNNSTDDDVTLYIYDDDDANNHLAVSRAVEDGTPERQCRIEYDDNGPSDSVTVDITGDQLSTDDTIVECLRGLWPDNDPEKIEYINIGDEKAAFEVTVDESSSIPTDVRNSAEVTDAIYSVTVDIGYQSQDLTFETTARVAPGEPR